MFASSPYDFRLVLSRDLNSKGKNVSTKKHNGNSAELDGYYPATTKGNLGCHYTIEMTKSMSRMQEIPRTSLSMTVCCD